MPRMEMSRHGTVLVFIRSKEKVMLKLTSVILAILVSGMTAAHAQQPPVFQNGNITPGHAAGWTTTGVIQDAGTAASPTLTTIGTVGQGPTICANSAPITSNAYQRFCLGVTTATGAVISLQNYGAPAGILSFLINGSTYPFP